VSSSARETMPAVGRAVSHESAELHVTGAALYVDDLVGRYPNVLHAWPVQSAAAHGNVRSIDGAAALRVPGVVRVLTAADVPGLNDTGASKRDEPLFPSVVEYAGQPVAWVLAESEEAAKHGAAAVVVDLEPLAPVLGIEAAVTAESFHTPLLSMARGDAEAALANAPRTLSGEFFMGAQEHFYLETQAALAYIDEAGFVFVHSSTQHPTETQGVTARVLGLEKRHVICQSLRMGGGFGGKETQANPFAAVAALGAWHTKRAVRVRLDRLRDITITGKRHPFLAKFRVGFEADGRVTALAVDLVSDGGFSLDLSRPVVSRAMFHIDNAYFVENLRVTGRVAKTNTVSHTAFRGFGGPQGMLVIEEVLARVAQATKVAPHLVRERNFYKEGHTTHYGQPVKDAARIERIWRELKASSDFERRLTAVRAHNASDAWSKRGLAITPLKFGISFTATYYNQGSALVLVYKDGSVQVNHGGTEMGQGLHTKMRQIAADGLGLPLDAVTIMPTRTDKVPNTSATAASAGTDLNGAAVRNACDALRGRIGAVAAEMLGVEAGALSFGHGRIVHGASGRALSFHEVVERAYFNRVPLFEAGHYKTPDLAWDEQKGHGKPFHYFAYGAAVSEVEVDGATGQYTLLRTDILHDVGDSISPLVDRGQVEGGFVQGVGWLTQEEMVWDKDGRIRTGNASTYKLPSLGECPEEFHVKLLERAAEPGVIHGSKAVGEPPFMLAMAVREALRDAVAAFGDGAFDLASPATPEAVYWGVQGARGLRK
jgi:xanthine dehydrogenase large subunit